MILHSLLHTLSNYITTDTTTVHNTITTTSTSRHLSAYLSFNPNYALQFNGSYTAEYVLAIALIVVGILVCLFTILFRQSHLSLGLIAFSWGGFYYAIYHSLPQLSTITILWSSALCSIGVGILPLVPHHNRIPDRLYYHSLRISTLVMGVCAGLSIWWGIFAPYWYIYNNNNPNHNTQLYAWGIMAVLGGCIGILCGLLGNIGIIISSSITGSFLAIQGFNWFNFATANVLVFNVLDRDIGTCSPSNRCIIVMSCFGGAAVLGMIIQFILYTIKLRRETTIVNDGGIVDETYVEHQHIERNPATRFGYNNTAVEPTRQYNEPSYNDSYIQQSQPYNNNNYYSYGNKNVYTPTNYSSGINTNNPSSDYPTLRFNQRPTYYA